MDAKTVVSQNTTYDLWAELESLSTSLREEALCDGKTIADILNELPETRRKVCVELYGKKQVEEWESKQRYSNEELH